MAQEHIPSPEIQPSETSQPQSTEGSKKQGYRLSRWVRWLIGSCLVTSLCICSGTGILQFSGILSGTHGDSDWWPSWSPDGSRILFVSDRDGNYDIYVMDVDGSHVRQLTRDPYARLYFIKSSVDATPAWSPDGKRIAFASGRNNGMMTFMDTDIYIMHSDGSHVVRLHHFFYTDASPAWSPDGKYLAFVGMPGPGANSTDIFVVDADSLEITELTSDLVGTEVIVWSPDSRNINFVSDHVLHTINLDSGQITDLTKYVGYESAPVLSPDGRWMAYALKAGDQRAIYVMNADGTNIRRLTDYAENCHDPSWSPDSSRIVYGCVASGDADIFIMNADGTGKINLTGNQE